jgi:hypothetical protein
MDEGNENAGWKVTAKDVGRTILPLSKYFPGRATKIKISLSNGRRHTTFILYVLLKKFGYCAPISIFAPYSSQV